jgi:Putative peptidoglycan binding domain
MNSRKFVLLGCVVACVFATSTATAQMRGHAGSMGGMGMRGAPMSHSMGMRGGFMPNSVGRMPMQRGPMMNSPSGFQRFGDRNFNRNDRFGRFNRFNDGRFARFDRFHRFDNFHHFNHNHFNNVVFIGNFGFPWWWGWGWAPWGGWGWGYPYGYYGGYNYGYYGSSYGYGDTSGSRVAELQSRLASAGYYHGAIDGILGPATRTAIRAYERDHGYVS